MFTLLPKGDQTKLLRSFEVDYHKENFPAVLTSISIYNGLVLRSRAFLQILSLPVESFDVLLLL